MAEPVVIRDVAEPAGIPEAAIVVGIRRLATGLHCPTDVVNRSTVALLFVNVVVVVVVVVGGGVVSGVTAL